MSKTETKLTIEELKAKAYQPMQDAAELHPFYRGVKTSQNISILDGYEVKEIKVDGSYARSIVIVKGTEEDELAVDATFVELNLTPNSACVAGLVNLNEKNQVIVDNGTHSNQLGIFAAGDVTDIYAEQVLICIGEGAKATLSAYEYILSL